MHPGIHPVVAAAIVGIPLAAVAVVLATRCRWIPARVLLGLLALLMLVPAGAVLHTLFPEVLDPRFRAYRSFYRELRPGMTRDEVFAALGRHYPASGPRRRPKLLDDDGRRIGFFMDPEHSAEPNCEGIFLQMADGRVVSKAYSAD